MPFAKNIFAVLFAYHPLFSRQMWQAVYNGISSIHYVPSLYVASSPQYVLIAVRVGGARIAERYFHGIIAACADPKRPARCRAPANLLLHVCCQNR